MSTMGSATTAGESLRLRESRERERHEDRAESVARGVARAPLDERL